MLIYPGAYIYYQGKNGEIGKKDLISVYTAKYKNFEAVQQMFSLNTVSGKKLCLSSNVLTV